MHGLSPSGYRRACRFSEGKGKLSGVLRKGSRHVGRKNLRFPGKHWIKIILI